MENRAITAVSSTASSAGRMPAPIVGNERAYGRKGGCEGDTPPGRHTPCGHRRWNGLGEDHRV